MPKGLRILVVEASDAVRSMLVHVLTVLGHQPVCAGNGEEALRCLARMDFDLVLTGLALPDIDGVTLRRRALERAPGLQVVVTCDGEGRSLEPGAAPRLLHKPFALSSLQQELDRVAARTLPRVRRRVMNRRW